MVDLIRSLEIRIVRRMSSEGHHFDDVHYTVTSGYNTVQHYYTRYRSVSGGEAYERQKFLREFNMREIG